MTADPVLLASFVFASCLCALATFVLYPVAVCLIGGLAREKPSGSAGVLPSVAFIVVARNAEALVGEKIDNTIALDYPRELLRRIFVSDGSTDRTAEILAAREPDGLQALVFEEHVGKAEGLNRAVASCDAEVLVFSDADAILETDAVRRLVRRYADPEVGGVCGQRVLSKEGTQLREAQSRYIDVDSRIKILESRIGSISSNDGKLYSIRRSLFAPIAPGVTDDLYSCLTVVEKGWRFVFEPDARARVRVPARNPSHELERRRRIVARSLRGIFLKRRLLNPFRYGLYSASLLINKVLRRMIPFVLGGLLLSSALLVPRAPVLMTVLAPQLLGYLAALSYPLFFRRHLTATLAGRVAATGYYFCLGNYGTLMGVLDFVRGRTFTKWDPVKTGGEVSAARVA